MMHKLFINKTAGNTVTYPFHSHTSWEILCYTKNKGHLWLANGMTIPFSVGTILLIPPDLPHGSRADSEFENIGIVDPAFPVHKLTCGKEDASSGVVLVTHDNTAGDITTLFQMCYRYWNSGIDSTKCIRHLLDAVEAIILDQINRSDDTDSASIAERMRNDFIEHFHDPEFTVADAICMSGISATKIRRVFRKAFGETPGEYLRSLRLKNAESLLQFSDESMTIAEIAQNSGFLDPLYFSRVFHEVHGQTPTAYRNYISKSRTERKQSEWKN